MAPKRSARVRAASDDDDSDYAAAVAGGGGGDTEPEQVDATPRAARRNYSKRRISDFTGDTDADGSFGADHHGGRPALKAVNMNDDAAEKRRRRKSAKISLPNLKDEDDAPELGPSSDGVAPDAPDPRRPLQPLQSVAQIPTINVPMDVMSSNFEEWMKMATDNVSTFPYFLCRGHKSVASLLLCGRHYCVF